MGHKDITMTVRYSHLAPKHTLAAVERLAGAATDTSTDTRTSTAAEAPIAIDATYVQKLISE